MLRYRCEQTKRNNVNYAAVAFRYTSNFKYEIFAPRDNLETFSLECTAINILISISCSIWVIFYAGFRWFCNEKCKFNFRFVFYPGRRALLISVLKWNWSIRLIIRACTQTFRFGECAKNRAMAR